MAITTTTFIGTNQTPSPTGTFSITVPSSAQIYVGVSTSYQWGAAPSVSGVTANGTALSNLQALTHSTSVTRRFELWYLKNPSAGTQNLVVSLNGTLDADHRVNVVVRYVVGADSTSPVRASAIAEDTGLQFDGPSVTSASGDTVIDFGRTRSNASFLTAYTGQTDPQVSGGSSEAWFTSLKAGAASSVSTRWDDGESGSPGYDGIIASVSLIPSGGAGAIVPNRSSSRFSHLILR